MNLEAESDESGKQESRKAGKQERTKREQSASTALKRIFFKMVGTSRSEAEIVAVRLQPTVCSEKGTRRVAMPL